MFKKSISLMIMIVILLTLAACATHVHTVGRGPQTGQEMEARQWYAVFGLVPINDVDTNQMAAGASDYEIKTEQTLIDGIITYFTSIVTVSCRTVKVTK